MSAIAAPRAPRAMLQPEEAGSTTLSNVFNNAAKKLYPRLALYEALARFKDIHKPRPTSAQDVCEYRRDFLDSFAYLCDVEKGGATVTATGLQELLHSNFLWLAANEGIREDVERYAGNLLKSLERLNQENHAAIEEEIFQLAVKTSSPRIAFYKREMQRLAKECRIKLRQELQTTQVRWNQSAITVNTCLNVSVRTLRSKLRKLSQTPPSTTLADLVDRCYAERGAGVESIRIRSTEADDEFSRLAHYIGRLGATRSSVHTIVKATLKVPALRNISEIRTIKAPEPRQVTIDPADTSPYEIVWSICAESPSHNPIQTHSALHATVDHDMSSGDRIHSTLRSRRTITTWVHAELQVADKFSRNKNTMQFVDDDKYVGCSKPACYFCYNWLCTHPHRYILPPTHHRILTGCRGPDSDINDAGAAFLRDMYGKMCGRLDQDILEFLSRPPLGTPQLRYHYMSTEGSSRPPSLFSTRPFIDSS